MPRAHRSMGKAAFGDCDGRPLTNDSNTGHLFAIPGVDPDYAVLLQGKDHRALYVPESLPQQQWPRVLRAASRYPHCQQPVRFTGTWFAVEPEAMPHEGDWTADPPYKASFKARSGHGLDFQRWSHLGLLVQITPRTHPFPGPSFLKRAIDADAPVTVRAICDGNRFEAVSVRFPDHGHRATPNSDSSSSKR